MYLRDTAPSFMKLFVARGRAVLDDQRKTVEGQIGQARAVGQFATTYGGPQVRKLVDAGLSRAWERAEEVLDTFGTFTGTSANVDTGPPPEPATPAAAPTVPGPTDQPGSSGGLAIADYDALSASQVVDRLEGSPPPTWPRSATTKRATGAANTVLGKIAQLTRPTG